MSNEIKEILARLNLLDQHAWRVASDGLRGLTTAAAIIPRADGSGIVDIIDHRGKTTASNDPIVCGLTRRVMADPRANAYRLKAYADLLLEEICGIRTPVTKFKFTAPRLLMKTGGDEVTHRFNFHTGTVTQLEGGQWLIKGKLKDSWRERKIKELLVQYGHATVSELAE